MDLEQLLQASEKAGDCAGGRRMDDLDHCDREITRLKGLLAHYQLCRETILTAQSTRGSPSSVHTLPDEILLIIFEYRVWWDHPSILDLLFVCRRWSKLISHSSILWTRIQIKPRFPHTECFNWATYVGTCLSRSSDLPLHVCIDLSYIWSREGFFSETIAKAVLEYVDQGRHKEVIRGLNFANLRLPSARYDRFRGRVIIAIARATGHGALLRRWKSLYLKLPTRGFTTEEWTWDKLAGTAEGMESLTIVNMAGVNSNTVSFPHLRHLSLLKDDDAHPDIGDISSLDIYEPSLLHLEYQVTAHWDNLKPLANFAHLETLRLHRPDIRLPPFSPEPKHLAKLSIRLPNLHTLVLSGTLSAISFIVWDLPALNRLEFIRHSAPQFEVELGPIPKLIDTSAPRVRPRQVQWTVAQPFRHTWCQVAITAALDNIVQHYHAADVIIVAEFAQAAVESLLAGFRDDPQFTTQFVFKSDSDEISV
ncbi:hypothetical protein M408DRAFT_330597 [Serendipita vermifera MAFF 305830]|uniref:F-box domain-containing protein n=1 Tax=Serendipita vermifera MAFF 305830 TaxID=933852 RepID=A0A0C3B2K9_SERVB|nr:hypothetical protein M408DRAFT_330597 [Serendipita vermifera MAFF 305830]